MAGNKPLRAKGRRDKPDPQQDGPPAPLMDLVCNFLKVNGFTDASTRLEQQAKQREGPGKNKTGGQVNNPSWEGAGKGAPSLVQVWEEWQQRNPGFKSDKPAEVEPKKEAVQKAPSDIDTDEVTSSSEEESEEDSEEDSESESEAEAGAKMSEVQKDPADIPLPESASESESEEEESSSEEESESESDGEEPATAKAAAEKTAASAESSESSESSESEEESSSDSDEESSDEETKPEADVKATPNPLKRKAPDSSSDESSSEDSSSSDSESDSEDEPKTKKIKVQQDSSSSDSSESEDESSSDSSSSDDGSDTEMKDAPKADSDSSDSSESEEDSSSSDESSEEEKATAKAKGGARLTNGTKTDGKGRNGSESSTTLHPTSPEFKPTVNGTTLANGKKVKEPFSRIPKDTKVDPKFASNEYVSYDYADRAHKDLSVVKGKNFTKEKNKKKRGSYKGGMIDTSGGRSIKFDD